MSTWGYFFVVNYKILGSLWYHSPDIQNLTLVTILQHAGCSQARVGLLATTTWGLVVLDFAAYLLCQEPVFTLLVIPHMWKGCWWHSLTISAGCYHLPIVAPGDCFLAAVVAPLSQWWNLEFDSFKVTSRLFTYSIMTSCCMSLLSSQSDNGHLGSQTKYGRI